MPLIKGFELKVLTSSIDMGTPLNNSLHSYVYNYGSSDVEISWEDQDQHFKETVRSGDSLHVQPFIKHAFACATQDASLVIMRVSGSINLAVQREISYFAHVDRVFHEDQCWF